MVHLGGVDNNLERQELAKARREAAGLPFIQITDESRLCFNCNVSLLEEINIMVNDPQCTRLNVLTQTSSHTCLICNAQQNLTRLSTDCRVHIFIKRNIYVPEYVVCCNNHLTEKGLLFENLIEGLRFINRPYILKGRQLLILLDGLRQQTVKNSKQKYEDESNLSENDFAAISPITKDQFLDLFSYCRNVSIDQRRLSKRDLLCYLCKMKQGVSDELLAHIFGYASRQSVSLKITAVRKVLANQFCTENIGFGAISRNDFILRHVTDFANRLYNNQPESPKAVAYADCTYLKIDQSSCFQALRMSYSVHKNYHLVKPSVIVASDGYILDIQGPYFANAANNDARILVNEVNNDSNGMRAWFQEGDIFICDRGYRDAIANLADIGVEIRIPPSLGPREKQFTTENANKSRIITSTRNVVEARNGHLKSMFKFFAQRISYHHALHLNDFLRIAGAMINRYKQLITRTNSDEQRAMQMLQKAEEVNVVQARIDAENLLNRRGRWVALTEAHFPLFPQLDEDFLRNYNFGTYQVFLSPSYVQDTLLRSDESIDRENNNVIQVDTSTEENGFIRIRIFSRYRNAQKHQLWIAYDEEYLGDDEENGHPLLGHYCTCKSGARTVGACAHVTAVCWYLGFARHQADPRYPSVQLLERVLSAE